MLNVLRMHRAEAAKIDEELVPPELLSAAQRSWDDAVELGERYGVRNSQATVLAPTGTIGLMMDCDTTGIEPDLALTKAKKLVGGGTMFIVNQTIPRALRNLGYSDEQVDGDRRPHRRAQDDHRCARVQPRAPAGVRLLDGRQHDPLHGSRHDDGCGAAVPVGRDLEDREPARGGDGRGGRAAAHRVVAARPEGGRGVPRQLQGRPAAQHAEDGRRATQPSTAARSSSRRRERIVERIVEHVIVQEPVRQKLPRVRTSKTFSFRVADCHGYVTVGEFEDGRPGRAVPPGGQAGLHARRDHGRVRDLGEPRPAVRRADRGVLRDVHEHALRARGHDRRPGHPVRDEPRRLHLPPAGGRVHAPRTSAATWASSPWASGSSRRCPASRRPPTRGRAGHGAAPARGPRAVRDDRFELAPDRRRTARGADAAGPRARAPSSATSAATSCSAPAPATPARPAAPRAAARSR